MEYRISTTRRRLEDQGFLGLSDSDVKLLNYWLRLSPAICLFWTAIGVTIASPAVLAVLVPFALLGAITESHPFDAIYNHGLRHVMGTPRLPAYGMPRRFACLMASVMIAAVGAMFAVGLNAAATIVGSILIAMATVNVASGFCVPSFIYGLIFGPVSCSVRFTKKV